MRSSRCGSLFRPGNVITGDDGGLKNNWAKGFHGEEFAGCVLDAIRKETERCDSLEVRKTSGLEEGGFRDSNFCTRSGEEPELEWARC